MHSELPAFFVSGALLLFGAIWATRSLKTQSSWFWISAGLAVFYVGILVVQSAFGFAGAINSSWRYLFISSIGLGLIRFAPSATPPRSVAEPTKAFDPNDSWVVFAVALVYPALCVFFNGLKVAVLEPPSDVDSLVYHIPIPVRMLQTGQITNGDVPYWFFPANSELIAHWLLSPLGNDLLVAFQNFVPAVMLICSISGFIFFFTRSTPLAFGLALCFWISVAPVRRQFFSQENDLFLAAFWLVALQMLLLWLESKAYFHLILSAASIGVVLGLKYSGVYYLGAYCLLLGCGEIDRRGFHLLDYARHVGLVLLIAAAMGGSWYMRNWLLLGSPMYPKDFGIFRLASTADAGTNMQTGIQSTILYYLNSISTYGLILEALRGFGGLLTLAAVLGLPVSLFIFCKEQKRLRLFWSAAILLTLLAPLISPYSAETIPGTLNMLKYGGTPMRYALPFLSLSVIMASLAINALRRVQGNFPADGLCGILVMSIPMARELTYPGGSNLLAILMCVVLGAYVYLYNGRSNALPHWLKRVDLRSGTTIVMLAAVVVSALWSWGSPRLLSARAERRNQIYAANYEQSGEKRTQLFAWCDAHLHQSVVGLSGPLIYPFFNTDLSNQAMIVTANTLGEFEACNPEKPHYLVITQIFAVPEFSSEAGTFPAWKDQLLQEPVRFRVVYRDEFGIVFELRPTSDVKTTTGTN